MLRFVGIFFLIIGTCYCADSRAQYTHMIQWKKKQPSLKIASSAQSVHVENCSSGLQIQTLNAWGAVANVSTGLTVNLAATAGVTFYSDANCHTPITTTTVSAGSSSRTVYFMATAIGSSTVTVSATGYVTAQQSELATANPFIWTGAGANALWSTAANWSGGVAPDSSKQVVFDSTCSSNCSPSLSANLSIAGVRIKSGFIGTIANGTYSMSIGSSGWSQNGGVFNGGTGTMIFYGPLSISAGTYTASSSTTTISSDLLISSAVTFNANSSTFLFNNRGSITTPASIGLNNVTFAPGNGANYGFNGTLTVNGNLVAGNSTNNVSFTGGTIEAKGNVTVTGYGAPGSTLLRLSGTGVQVLDALAANAANNLPSIEIASSGAVTLKGNLYLEGTYTYTTAGSFDAGTSLIAFVPTSTVTVNMGSVPYYDLAFFGKGSSVNVAADVTVTHALTLGVGLVNAGTVNGPGKIQLKGDLNLPNAGAGGSSNLLVVFSGASNQAVNVTSAYAMSPSIEVNSTGGTVAFPATFDFFGDFVYTQGTISGLTTAKFSGRDGAAKTLTPGAYVFNNLIFACSSGNSYTITGLLSVNGTLTYAGTGPSRVTGAIDLYGDLVYTSFYEPRNSLVFRGNNVQTVTHSGYGFEISVGINKTGGTVRLLSNTNWSYGGSSFSITNGTLDMNGYSLSLYGISSLNGNTITKNGGTLTVHGATIGTGSYYGGTIAP